MDYERRYTDRNKDVAGAVQIVYRRYVIARLYAVLSIFVTVLSMIFEPTSRYSQAAVITNAPNYLFLFTFFVCALALADIAINDFAPDKFTFLFAYKYRHLIYMAMALISFSISVSIFYTFGASILLCRLWLDGVVAAAVAMLDIFARHRGNLWLSGTLSQ